MLFEFDPSAIRAELKTEGDHWVVAIEMAAGRWGHRETRWRYVQIPRDEIRNAIGNDPVSHSEEVIAYLEESLRGAGWRAARQGKSVSLPVLEVWVQYRSPLFFDDEVDISLVVGAVTRTTFQIAYLLSVAGQPRATAVTVHGCVDRSGRPSRLPEWVRSRFRSADGSLS